jgi:hypothetical protein
MGIIGLNKSFLAASANILDLSFTTYLINCLDRKKAMIEWVEHTIELSCAIKKTEIRTNFSSRKN